MFFSFCENELLDTNQSATGKKRSQTSDDVELVMQVTLVHYSL